MAASGAPVRQPRRGPAPIASFDHDVSDESSPETKQAFRLPEIVEDCQSRASLAPDAADAPGPRARSHSTPAAGALAAPPTPRIDISRASSSSHQDSRDSSPELALFAGSAPAGGELGFREDGALDLRSSTEELAFLEPAPGERPAPPAPPAHPAPPPPPHPPSRRHSRKDSQGSEAALLGVSGRTSRLSSVGSQCSAHSALSAYSRVSRLSVASGASRSPSPHRMLLETSFCGPKPIETDPEICAAAVEERLLEMAKLGADVTSPTAPAPPPPAPTPAAASPPAAPAVDARDRREVRTEATVERATPRPSSTRHAPPATTPEPGWAFNASTPAPPPARIIASPSTAPAAGPSITSPTPAPQPGWSIPAPNVAQPEPGWSIPAPTVVTPQVVPDDDKRQKETRNRVKAEERRARSRERRDSGESRTKSRSKDIIRIRLKPDSEYEDDDDDEDVTECGAAGGAALKPATLELGARPARPTELSATDNSGATAKQRKRSRDSRTPSPAGVIVSRKSSFCSLFKSRETIASPESPSDALRRKKSLNEGRSRSRSRDRSATPTSATKIKGSVLSLFKTPRKSATSPSPSSRDGSPSVQPQRHAPAPSQPSRPQTRAEKLKYYEDAKDGIIHIPLRTPPDEIGAGGSGERPASAPQQRVPPSSIAVTSSPQPGPGHISAKPSAQIASSRSPSKPIQRTVLPDGSIIIPLRSPTERSAPDGPLASTPAVERRQAEAGTPSRPASVVDATSLASSGRASIASGPASIASGPASIFSGPTSITPPDAQIASATDITPSPDPAPRPQATESSKRRERLVFMTQVGSGDQVFSTQFSITKTPSVTSEISGSFASFPESEAAGKEAPSPPSAEPAASPAPEPPAARRPLVGSPPAPRDHHDTPDLVETTRDSSESEASSEAGAGGAAGAAAAAAGGTDVERRGLVVAESFEDELPYVPTTLPQERSLALPMVPVRERGDVRVARVERPRPPQPHPPPHAHHKPKVPPAPPATPAPRVSAAESDKLRIRLPRRPRTASASAPPRHERARARSGSDGTETRPKAEWIDFEEVPERRKQPKRIQTLPAGAPSPAPAAAPAPRDLVFCYVEPEDCRCECHARADDETPLLDSDQRLSSSPVEGECDGDGGGGGSAGCGGAHVQLSVQLARPFTADLQLGRDSAEHQDGGGARP